MRETWPRAPLGENERQTQPTVVGPDRSQQLGGLVGGDHHSAKIGVSIDGSLSPAVEDSGWAEE
jgi:hypothetical protein